MSKKQKHNRFKWVVIGVFATTLLWLIGSMVQMIHAIYRYNHNLSSQLMSVLFVLGPVIIAKLAFFMRRGTRFDKVFFGTLFGSIYIVFSVGIPSLAELILFHSTYAQDWILYESMLSVAMVLVGALFTAKLVNSIDIQ